MSEYSVSFSHLKYQGAVTRVDTERYCCRVLTGNGKPAIEREVLAAVIARLALWDKGLADVLCTKPLADILSLDIALRPLAAGRKWRSQMSPSWESGCSNIVDGKECYNSLFLYVSGQMEEIHDRIWRAQLQVLFPYIEEQRDRFIKLIRELEFISPDTNFAEMEFKSIRHHVNHHIPQSKVNEYSVYVEIAHAFGEVRNRLAHHQVASVDELDAMFRAAAAIESIERSARSRSRTTAGGY